MYSAAMLQGFLMVPLPLCDQKGVFISVPVRLGLDRIEPECLEILKEVFTFESTLGIAGG